MTPRPYTTSERAAWLPILAEFVQACAQGDQAVADAIGRQKADLDGALMAGCDCTAADLDVLNGEQYINALASLMLVNAEALSQEVPHGNR